jgi:hypothetical protein
MDEVARGRQWGSSRMLTPQSRSSPRAPMPRHAPECACDLEWRRHQMHDTRWHHGQTTSSRACNPLHCTLLLQASSPLFTPFCLHQRNAPPSANSSDRASKSDPRSIWDTSNPALLPAARAYPGVHSAYTCAMRISGLSKYTSSI